MRLSEVGTVLHLASPGPLRRSANRLNSKNPTCEAVRREGGGGLAQGAVAVSADGKNRIMPKDDGTSCRV